MPRATLLTGSNRSDRAAMLARAAEAIEERVGTIVRRSGVHESVPWGFDDSQCFLNQALVVETALEPLALLNAVQAIERELGRVRVDTGCVQGVGARTYASRLIDIDILFYDDLKLRTERLTLPHPLIGEREFVLVPLREVVDFAVF